MKDRPAGDGGRRGGIILDRVRPLVLLAASWIVLTAVETPPWAERSGQDEHGAWAVLACPAAPLRARLHRLPDGGEAWLAERAFTAAELTALEVDGAGEGSSWRQALAACTAVERHQPRVRLMLPPLAWLRAAPPSGVQRAWAGDLLIARIPASPELHGVRIDPHLMLPLWGPLWSAAELPAPRGPRPAAAADAEEPTPEQQAWDAAEAIAGRVELAVSEFAAPAWVAGILAGGRANDGATAWAAADERIHPGVAIVPALLTVAGPGEVAGAPAALDGPQPRIGMGHRSQVARCWPSPDGRWVLTTGDGCRIWDLSRALPVGVLRRADGLPIDATIACWSPDGSAVTTVSEDGLVAQWEARRAALRWTANVEVDDGSWASMVQGRAEMRMFPDRIDAVDDGRSLRIVVTGHQRSIQLTSATRLLASDGSVLPEPFPPPDGAAIDGVLASGFPEACLAVDQEDDGKVLLQVWDAAGTALRSSIALPWEALPAGSGLLLLHADGRHVLAADDRGSAAILDIVAGTVLRTASIDPESACLVAADRRGTVLLGDAAQLAALRPALAPFACAAPPPGRLAAAGLSLRADRFDVELRDGATVLARLPVDTPAFSGAAFSAPDRLLLTAAGTVHEIDLRLGVAVSSRSAPEPPAGPDAWEEAPRADPECDGEQGRRWRIDRLGAWRTIAGPPGSLPPDPLRRDPLLRHTAIATATGLHASCDRYRLTLRRADGALLWWREAGEPPEGALEAVAISPDGRLIATAGHQAALWRAADGALLARFACGPGGPIAVAPDGRYAARGDPGAAIAFSWLDEMWPVTEFDLACNRPDLVVAGLGVADGRDIAALNRAWEARCRRLGVPTQAVAGAGRLPRAMLDRATLPLAVDAAELELDVVLEPVPTGTRLVLRLDDVPVPDRAGVPAAAGRMRLRAPLAPGHNRIAVSLRLPDGREGLRDTAWTVRRGTTPAPRLHLLAVGCSRYRQSGLDLDFAAKDAADLAAAVAPGALVLTDQDAVRERIAAGAAERFAQAAPGDTVVLFLAGHGVLDGSGGYWFLAHDADPRDPAARGLSFADLEALLERTPARRRLLLLDTCHAGEADGQGLVAVAAPPGAAAGVRARGLKGWRGNPSARGFDFLDLRSGVGAAVIASSAAAEFALESPAWANGVFTLATIEGWGRAAADADSDGAVRTSELAAYVARRVRDLTAGAQSPGLRSANRSRDAELPRPAR